MPSDYKEICKDNIRRRGEDFEDIGRLLSEQLYNEKSHFVYELLQNAEDALERRFRQHSEADFSCRVEFKLYPDRLEFRHFGELFNENDVKGIADVLKGTKAKDFKQIGTFGIGFKSVYAFTASPEIHSGDEHFVIKSYIRPEAKCADPTLPIEGCETVFIFPFDHKEFPEENAFELILNKLRGLGARVLLFLRRIEEIKWSIEPDGEEGHYLKETQEVPDMRDAHYITVIGQKSGQDEDENWLIFERPATVPDESYELRVEVAFRLEAKTEDTAVRVAKINDAPLVVYFPTEKATQLGFLVQGPYMTTPARDNIQKDEDWNKTLITETAELFVESLRQLKKMDLLSVSLLEALPIRADAFPEGSMFYPIFSRVKGAFLSEEFLPAEDGTFVAASNAKLARGADLMKLLDRDQLQKLLQSDGEIKWLSGKITQDRAPDLRSYLINELTIDEITPGRFASHLSGDFLTGQSDEWFIEFYQFLPTHKALWRLPRLSLDEGGILQNKPILRLQNGSYANPSRHSNSPSAYLATETDIETSLPIVKVSLSSDDGARKFLQELGIPDLDIVEEVIEKLLPKYLNGSVTVDLEKSEHDLMKINRAYETDSAEKKERLRSELMKTPFILVKLKNGEREYGKIGKVYFETDDLRLYFEGNKSGAFVDSKYSESAMELLRNLGVKEHLRVIQKEINSKGYVIIRAYHGNHVRGIDGFDPDIVVDGLENALESPSVEKSIFIWNKIAVPHSNYICGFVESSSRQTYEDSREKRHVSENFGRLLIDNAWLPNPDGHLHKPGQLTLDDLPEPFVRDEILADRLGMKKNVVAKLAEEAGISEKVLNRAKQIEDATPEIQQQIDSLLQKGDQEKPQQQENIPYTKALAEAFLKPGKEKVDIDGTGGNGGSSPNPTRRREKISEDIADAIENEGEPDERFSLGLRKKWNGKNDQVRMDLAEWYDGRCQICENTFTQCNGDPYFEGLYLVSYTTAGWINRVGNVLCLCAWHGAMFQFGPKEVEEDIIQQILRLKVQQEGGDGNSSIRMKLCGEPVEIKFAEKHLIDLQEMVKKSRKLQLEPS